MAALTINDVPFDCINQAAIVYNVPAPLIISVLKAENGRVGMARHNNNGTYDLGPMQINTFWLHKLNHFGYTSQALQYDPCINVAVGAWILSMNIGDSADLWTGVGDYHSHTPTENFQYSVKVKSIYKQIESVIQTG